MKDQNLPGSKTAGFYKEKFVISIDKIQIDTPGLR